MIILNIIAVYDDTGRKSDVIADIIGDKGFADVVVKKRKLEDYYRDEVKNVFPNLRWRKIHSSFEYAELIKEMELFNAGETRILHCFSNYLISDKQKVSLSLKKLAYIDEQYAALDGRKVVLAMFPSSEEYIAFCKTVLSGQKPWDLAKKFKESFEVEGFIDIGSISNFIQCVTGNFDSRYFNSLKENVYTIVKSSRNKQKIKAEYSFYHLLPEDMKFWFVMPFNYQETKDTASYTMERLHMTDLAIKWVYGSMDEKEFEELTDKFFFFIKSRHTKACTEEEYKQISDKLYVEKVQQRTADLKKMPEYEKLSRYLSCADGCSIDELVAKYLSLKARIEEKAAAFCPPVLAIGHGDPCFSNALYNKFTKTLKFIDPKGAVTEEELWTNPYYDIAKFSHSVCGNYDFFNNALYDIKIDSVLDYNLEVPFDNTRYVGIFRQKLEENGFDYLLVRIYEVSLFLSMLPLHIDNPHKVFSFVLNARNILREIEDCV